MAKFTVETEYMLPVYRRIEIEAPTHEEACRIALHEADWTDCTEETGEAGESSVSGVWPEGATPYLDNSLPIPEEYLPEAERLAFAVARSWKGGAP